VHVPPGVSLTMIAVVLLAGIAASKFLPSSKKSPVPARPCTHRDTIRFESTDGYECPQCVAQGDTWVQLRMCTACGQIGCCDTSKNKHASAHYRATGHPIVRSIEPGERWKWCYVDETLVD
jgi:uncharacterized UBP type Zn finger protein